MFTAESLDGGGAQLYPCGIATATPQHFTVASGTAIYKTAQEFPEDPATSPVTRYAPHPAHIRQIGAGKPLRDV